MLDAEKAAALTREQVERASPAAARRLRRLLVAPRCEQRSWDYGTRGAAFPCWIVAEHGPSNTVFAYCEHGFGPAQPWGLLSGDPKESMGMDSSWYASLEDAFLESWASGEEYDDAG